MQMTIRFIPALMTLTDVKSSEEAAKELCKWFHDNLMKSNSGKCHLLVRTNDNVAIRIERTQIERTKREKLLFIQFDNTLSFDYHLSEVCQKASRTLYALDRVISYINLSKRKILMNAFFSSQFSYCLGCVIVASLTKN